VPSPLAHSKGLRARWQSLAKLRKFEQPYSVPEVRKDYVKLSNLVHVAIATIDVHLSKPTRLESIVAFRKN
jgi:hypothetical protein